MLLSGWRTTQSRFRRANDRAAAAARRRGRTRFAERLEPRRLMDGDGWTPVPFAQPALSPAADDSHLTPGQPALFGNSANVFLPIGLAVEPQASATIAGYSPQLVRQAYGLDQLSVTGAPLDGSGQTIAIVDAYDDPTIAADLQTFDQAYGLPAAQFVKVEQSVNGATPAANANWAIEISLDVEWAHTIAPGARIMLVEDVDAGDNLFNMVSWAAEQPGVSVVSMSFGSPDMSYETALDSVFTTPAGHQGVTFVAASGDRGNPDYPANSPYGSYPALSPNVVGVGATELETDSQGNYAGEYATSYSGGGYSLYEAEPAYQVSAGIVSGNLRTSPDVSFLGGDGSLALPICDSYTYGSSAPWVGVAGTSAAAPQFSALLAMANQGRALVGEGTLDGPSQTLPLLYELSTSFHDITAGGSLEFPAAPGYDLSSGLGTPIGNILVPQLVAGGFLSLDAQGVAAIDATAGTKLVGQSLATFFDPNGAASTSSYTATIDWGDGTTSAGAVVFNAAAGTFTVTGNHTYAASGAYTVAVSVARDGGPAVNLSDAVQVAPSNGSTSSSGPASSDPAPSLTPNEQYVTAVYEALFGRAPQAGELQAWAGELDSGLSPLAFVDTLDHSGEYFDTLIEADYQNYLGRSADAAGLAYWQALMQEGTTDEEVEAFFIASPEFYANVGGSDWGWVNALYQHLLGRGADAQGLDFWLGQLAANSSRVSIAYGFTGSLEREAQRIEGDYQHYLNRDAEQGGLDYWLSALEGGWTNEDLITGFLASDEYYNDHS